VNDLTKAMAKPVKMNLGRQTLDRIANTSELQLKWPGANSLAPFG